MKVESRLFLLLTPFFVIVSAVYGLLTYRSGQIEIAGTLAILLLAGLVGMIGWYLMATAKRIDQRPEDDPLGEIEQGAGEQGAFAPWSWWPLAIGFGVAVSFLGLAVGWWIVGIGGIISILALVGWVFEFSRGQHAH